MDVDELGDQRVAELGVSPQAAERDVLAPLVLHWERHKPTMLTAGCYITQRYNATGESRTGYIVNVSVLVRGAVISPQGLNKKQDILWRVEAEVSNLVHDVISILK